MSLVEDAKAVVERVTGLWQPSARQLLRLREKVEPEQHHFADDGRTPNNRLPLLIYRQAVRFDDFDPAAVFERLFARHGWRDSWRDGIYPFNHFHSATHEVLGIARGRAKIRFGGSKGRDIAVSAGDVIVLPAGTGHRRIAASSNLLVVGAYPAHGDYDEPKATAAAHDEAVKRIQAVRLPSFDPVHGRGGPLRRLWSKRA